MRKPTVLSVEPGCLSDYYDWLKSAAHGDILVYWRGDLRFDRDPDNCPEDRVGERLPSIRALDAVAKRILEDAKGKKLILIQKRVDANEFEYRAVRQRAPHDNETGRRVYGYLLPV